MPRDVIDCIHALAHRQGAIAGLAFTDQHGLAPNPDDLNPDDEKDCILLHSF